MNTYELPDHCFPTYTPDGGLDTLLLRHWDLGASDIQALEKFQPRRIEVDAPRISIEAAVRLAQFPNLRSLWLHSGVISDEYVEEMASGIRVEELLVMGKGICDQGVAFLSNLNLNAFGLAGKGITDAGIAALATGKVAGSLRSFILRDTSITERTIELLREFPQLQRLVISETPITDISKLPDQLDELALLHTRIGDKTCEKLRDLRNLKNLNLSGNSIGNSTARICMGLPYLESLRIDRTLVDDDLVCEIGTSLKAVAFHGSNISKEGKLRFKKLNPHIIINDNYPYVPPNTE